MSRPAISSGVVTMFIESVISPAVRPIRPRSRKPSRVARKLLTAVIFSSSEKDTPNPALPCPAAAIARLSMSLSNPAIFLIVEPRVVTRLVNSVRGLIVGFILRPN